MSQPARDALDQTARKFGWTVDDDADISPWNTRYVLGKTNLRVRFNAKWRVIGTELNGEDMPTNRRN